MTPAEIREAVLHMPPRVAVALTVDAEARGEPDEGVAGVAWVIKNRAAQWHQTPQAVCLAPWQFSAWWLSDANSARLFKAAEAVVMGATPGISDPDWLRVANICNRVLTGTLPDPTDGATYYITERLLEDKAHQSDWYARQVRNGVLVETARIGGHVFHREVKAA